MTQQLCCLCASWIAADCLDNFEGKPCHKICKSDGVGRAHVPRLLSSLPRYIGNGRGGLEQHPGGHWVSYNDVVKAFPPEVDAQFEMPNAIWLAKFVHDAYERLAPQYGYVTREDTRDFDHESPNGRLMAAVFEELRAALSPQKE